MKQGEIKLSNKIVKKKDESRTEKVYAVVPKNLKDALRKYVASIAKEDRKATESEIINRALEEYLEMKTNEKSVSKLETMLEKVIDEKLGFDTQKLIKLEKKNNKFIIPSNYKISTINITNLKSNNKLKIYK